MKFLIGIVLVVDQSRHLYSVSFNCLCQRVVLCGSCAGTFMIKADGKKICSHFKAELRFDDNEISVTYCV